MRKIFYFLLILTVSCSNLKSTQTGDLQLKILESNINDNTEVEVDIINNSKKNYYLLLDTTSFHQQLNFYYGSSMLYSMHFNICDEFNNYIPQRVKVECDNQFERKNFTTKDVLKIRKGETIKLKIPFRINHIVHEYCQIRYQTELMKKETKYYVELVSYEPNKYYKTILSGEVNDSLKNLNYKLYKRKISSNKVRLNFDIK